MMQVYSRPLFDAEMALEHTLWKNPPTDPHVAQAFEALYVVLEKLTDELCTLNDQIREQQKTLQSLGNVVWRDKEPKPT
jgi:hypothetical protein